MATQVIQIGRQRFICGLFWQSLSRRHALRAEAVELAARLNFDAMVLRIDRTFAGAGFASTREGAQLGLPSLGALVSKTIAAEGAFYDGRQQPAPNWLGAFHLPDGRWAYFAVRDGAFLPNGDWIGSSEEVFERLHSDYSLGGWNVVIGDPQLEVQGFHNFYARRIDDMIPRRGGKPHLPRWLNLSRVSRRAPRRAVLLVAAAIGVAAAVAAGIVAYRRHRMEVERQQAFERMRAELALHPPKPAAPPEAAHPWASEPRPDAFVRACVDHFTHIAPGGWELDDYVCRASNVSYSWSRGGSNVAMLMAAEPRATIDGNGEHASYVEPLALPAGGDEVLDGVHGVRLRMLSAFQLLGIGLTFTLQPASVPQRSLASQTLDRLQPGGGAPPAPSWQTWRMSAQLGDVRPDSLIRYLDQPGVRVETLSYKSGQWTLDGVLYEK
ncbi:type 4b pilus protein PilO2 [Burkholderia dolosa]|uniref:type 4b pilus protein PilO2 n=1 Tax=Burkholderia dolosa TaxID=152500 RepID=UPI001C94013A|nr:type 4b pilus protein PilO2 [Burkholderia dolosa]MBY4833140.1 type 4b pilus protein PilO2 [Burkholderia dolosa]